VKELLKLVNVWPCYCQKGAFFITNSVDFNSEIEKSLIGCKPPPGAHNVRGPPAKGSLEVIDHVTIRFARPYAGYTSKAGTNDKTGNDKTRVNANANPNPVPNLTRINSNPSFVVPGYDVPGIV